MIKATLKNRVSECSWAERRRISLTGRGLPLTINVWIPRLSPKITDQDLWV